MLYGKYLLAEKYLCEEILLVNIEYALRDERANIVSMTMIDIPSGLKQQFLLCKKRPMKTDNCYLLDMKKSNPTFPLSNIGEQINELYKGKEFELTYVAFIDCQLKVKVDLQLFTYLSNGGYFSIWEPEAPLKYFDSRKYGYLVIFRVFKIEDIIPEALLEKGRKGRNYYYRLSQTYYTDAKYPIIENSKFRDMKNNLIKYLESQQWLAEIIESDYELLPSEKYAENELESDLLKAVERNAKLSLEELENLINNKKCDRRSIIVESSRFYRDPDIVSYALKRANGVCECCNSPAPFAKKNGDKYLEVHHLIPLSEQGEDKIENVCAVCPNCHRELHYGKQSRQLAEKIKLRLNL